MFLYIASELAPNGELYNIVDGSGGLKSDLARTLFMQILNAVEYIHSQGYAHRDLKLENFLMDEEMTVKLADFGLCKSFTRETLSTYCGTRLYIAPEVIAGDPYEGAPVDIFALGIVLYIMLTSRLPFTEVSDASYGTFLSDPTANLAEHHVKLEPEVVELIRGMVEPNPKERLTMKQIKKHPWFGLPFAKQQAVAELV